MLPFNTDGIDPGQGSRDFAMRRLTVENFDDVVAVKPCNGDCDMPTNTAAAADNNNDEVVCTENILSEDFKVFLGVGLSVGSVHPHSPDPNCIRGVVFRRSAFYLPFKAVYVKTNSGEDGYGSVTNVTYEDILIRDPKTVKCFKVSITCMSCVHAASGMY